MIKNTPVSLSSIFFVRKTCIKSSMSKGQIEKDVMNKEVPAFLLPNFFQKRGVKTPEKRG